MTFSVSHPEKRSENKLAAMNEHDAISFNGCGLREGLKLEVYILHLISCNCSYGILLHRFQFEDLDGFVEL